MRTLLDTCVLSEIRKADGNVEVKKAVQSCKSSELFISVITIGEIVKGIELLQRGAKKSGLQEWIRVLEKNYSSSILPIDSETVHLWGELTATAQLNGKIIPVSDGLIAATAKRHGLHIMTRNVSDFENTGAMIANPWE